jgi:hypothetical protein
MNVSRLVRTNLGHFVTNPLGSVIHSFIQSPGSDKIRDYRGFCGRFEEGVVNSLEIGRLRDLGR